MILKDAVSIAVESLDNESSKRNFRVYCNKFKEAWGIPDYDPEIHKDGDPILFNRDPDVIYAKIRNCLRWLRNIIPKPGDPPLGCTRPTEAKPNEQPLSRKYRRSLLSALRRLYSQNNVDIKDYVWKNLKDFLGPKDVKKGRAYTLEQLQALFKSDLMDRKFRVIVLVYACTGFRLGVISQLTWGQVRRVVLNGIEYESYRIGPVYSKTDYVVAYTTPEAFHEINGYRAYRERAGEVITDDKPFIRNDWNLRSKSDDQINNPKPIATATIEAHILRIAKDSFITKSDGTVEPVVKPRPGEKECRNGQHRHLNAVVHAIRSFWYTVATNTGLDEQLRDSLIGHHKNKDDLERTYYDEFDPLSEEKAFLASWRLRDKFTILPENRAKLEAEEAKRLAIRAMGTAEEYEKSREKFLQTPRI